MLEPVEDFRTAKGLLGRGFQGMRHPEDGKLDVRDARNGRPSQVQRAQRQTVGGSWSPQHHLATDAAELGELIVAQGEAVERRGAVVAEVANQGREHLIAQILHKL